MKIIRSYHRFLISLSEQYDSFFLLLLRNNYKFFLSNFKYQLWPVFFFEMSKILINMKKTLNCLCEKHFFSEKNKSNLFKLFKLKKSLIVIKSNFFLVLNILNLIPISIIHLKFTKNIKKIYPNSKKYNLHSFKIVDKKKVLKDVAIFINLEYNSKIIFLMIIQKRKILKILNKIIQKKAYFIKKDLFAYSKKFFNGNSKPIPRVANFLLKWNLIKLKIDKTNNFVYISKIYFESIKTFFLYRNLLNLSHEIFLEHILVSDFLVFKRKKNYKKRFFFYVINNMFKKQNLIFYSNLFLDASVLNILFNTEKKLLGSKNIDKKYFLHDLQKCKLEIMKKKKCTPLRFCFSIFLCKTIKIENLFLHLILEIIYSKKKCVNNTLKWIFCVKFNFNIMLYCFSNIFSMKKI